MAYLGEVGDHLAAFPTIGKQLYNTPRNQLALALNYSHGPYWAGINAIAHSSIYGDYMNTERVGGYSTVGLNAGYKFDDFSPWFKRPYIKLNVFNLLDHQAFINANNAAAFLASNPNKITGVDGGSLFTSAPYYTLLEPRTFRTRDEARTGVLEDDRRLRDGLVARSVAEHGELGDRPEPRERGARAFVREVDQMLLEGDLELVEPDEGLPAERRERVIVEREGHGVSIRTRQTAMICKAMRTGQRAPASIRNQGSLQRDFPLPRSRT